MELTNNKTNKILIKAFTNSDIDYCNAIILEINDNFLKFLSDVLKEIQNLKEKPFYMSFLNNSSDFLYINEEFICELEDYNKGWEFIKNCDENELTLVNQKITGQELRIYSQGEFNFVGWGKHTNDEFWSESLNIQKLLNIFKFDNTLVCANCNNEDINEQVTYYLNTKEIIHSKEVYCDNCEKIVDVKLKNQK